MTFRLIHKKHTQKLGGFDLATGSAMRASVDFHVPFPHRVRGVAFGGLSVSSNTTRPRKAVEHEVGALDKLT